MSRKISVPTSRAHLDFLHPARNLWRLRLGSVRLSELERHVLGWDRGADQLSGLIPPSFTRSHFLPFCRPKQIEWRRSLAKLAQREGDYGLACELWQDAVGNSRHSYEAYEQLAIYYENKARDPERALAVVRQAISELCNALQTGEIAPGAHREFKMRFDRRMERL